MGQPFEPRTVRTKSDLRGSGRVVLPLAFMRGDDGRWRAKWMHLYLGGYPRFNRPEGNHVSAALLMRGYVADLARIGAALGVPEPPRTEAELAARIAEYRPELAATAQAREVARFLLLSPPLPIIARPPYGVLAAAAVSLLPGWARRPLRLPRLPVTEAVVVRPAGHAMVHAIRWATTAPLATAAT